MIRLRIDGQECDLYEDFTLPEKVVQLDVEAGRAQCHKARA